MAAWATMCDYSVTKYVSYILCFSCSRQEAVKSWQKINLLSLVGESEDGLSYCDAQLTFCDGSTETNQSILISGVEQNADHAAGPLSLTRNRLEAVEVMKRALNQG